MQLRWNRAARRAATTALALAAVGTLAACGESGSGSKGGASGGDGGDRYEIVMSNGFVSSWRTQMQDMTAAMADDNAPYKGRVDFKVVVSESTPSAQIQSLNNIISTGPDAILIDALSPTALNPVVKKACAQGIVVVYFDQIGEGMEKCAYRVHVDLDALFERNAEWLAETLGGRGRVLQDLGLAGSPVSLAGSKAAEKVFARYPGIEIVNRYEGNYTPGPTKQAVSRILTSTKGIDGVYGIAGVDGAVQAFEETGTPMVPMTNTGDMSVRLVNLIDRYRRDGLEFSMAMNSPVIAGQALQVAWAALEDEDVFDAKWEFTRGEDDEDVITPRMAYQTNDVRQPDDFVPTTFAEAQKMARGLPDSVQLPYSLPQSPVRADAILGGS